MGGIYLDLFIDSNPPIWRTAGCNVTPFPKRTSSQRQLDTYAHHLSHSNYRSLRDIRVPLKQLNLVTGANGLNNALNTFEHCNLTELNKQLGQI